MSENLEEKEYKNDPERITYMGSVDYRNKMVKFGIKAKDRTKHLYVIGKSGMGKSTLLENMAIQDIQNGEGLAFIDPHGGTAEKLLDFVPEDRKDDVIYFAPFDTEYPVALNVLEKVDINKRHLVANGLMAAFKKVFGEDKFSDRMQYILNNIILTLLENDDETLIGINRILSDKEYRKKMVANVQDPSIRSFWLEEFVKAGEKYQQEAAPAIQNKIGQFTSNPLIRNIIGQKRTSFDIREVMDKRKILIINLSKGKMGEGNANLIGSLLITKIYSAAMSRADVDPYKLGELPPFYFYVDEFQNFANDSFAQILSEARKYQLALTVAHQYVDQMTEEVKAAIFGNIGTMVTFRVGATDAQVFEKEFAPVFSADDIVNLSAFQMYLRLMIDSVGSKPFSAKGLLPIAKPATSHAEEIIEHSRKFYGKKKEEVEKEISDWYIPVLEKDLQSEKRSSYQGHQKTNGNRVENDYKKTEKKTFDDRRVREERSNERTRPRRKDRDIDNTDISKIREEESKAKEKLSSNNTSLKEALEKAMQAEKVRQNNVVRKEQSEASKFEKVEKVEKNERAEKREEVKEVPEKILRDLVDEE
ncbi:MAG: type IV secretion system DNA-binding domain-containing protein [Candidatus Pacebacteria bacterium]|nr:type IV secretion system DNA-binding domain-containing protein [Candidatus Paceibacterota bacterium]